MPLPRPLAIAIAIPAMLLDGPPTPAQCTPRWELRVQAESPEDMDALGDIAYDDVRDRIVFYGHSDFFEPSQTWEFVEGAWIQRSVGGPVPIGGFGIAFDHARNATVLFGGSNFLGNTLYSDTWTWNGEAWTLQSPATRPSPRAGHATTYDSAAGEVLIHGGRVGATQISGQTWGWDGTTWNARGNGPALIHARMVYDTARSCVVLFGGASDAGGTVLSAALWERPTGGEWQAVSVKGPAPEARIYFGIAYDARHARTLVVGGETDAGVTDESWTWDGTQWTPLFPVGSPDPSVSQALVYDPVRWSFLLHRTELDWELREFGRGDVNCDCLINVGDIAAFVLALTAPDDYLLQFDSCNPHMADLNCDGRVSISDISSFVNCIVTNDCDCL